MERDNLQRNAIDILKNDKRLILQWATGVGKGYMAVKALDEIKPKKTLLVVAEIAHKENWRKEFEKLGVNLYHTLVVECYASLKNYRNTEWDLIIFDEVHHLGSDLRTDILQSLKAERVLALSATLSDASLVNCLTFTFGQFKVSKVSMQDAIDNGYLPEPKVFLIPLKLDNKYKNCYLVEEWGRKEKRVTIKCDFKDRWQYIKNKKSKYPNVTLIMTCTEAEKYYYLNEQFNYWQQRYYSTRNEAIKNKWLMAGTTRKTFLGNLKTTLASSLISKIRDKRFICFCTNIEQATFLGGDNAIHSKRNDNAEIIKKFNDKVINSIFAVGMLQEGQNLADIEAGIIIQLDGKERAFIQKFGRSMRAEDPVQYIFYYKDTKDVDYLKNVLENIDSDYIKEVELNEICNR